MYFGKRFLCAAVFMLSSVAAFCQSTYKINVTSFKSDTYDISGSTEAKQDRFGRDCALIKIKTPNCNEAERSRFTVKCDAGAQVVMPDKEGIGELRRYVTATCVRLFIQHPDFGETEYALPMKLKAKSTYVMEIMVDKPTVLPMLMSNYVVINVTPVEAAKNAKITIDDNYIENNQAFLSLNEPHHLVIESKLYHTIDKIIYADKDKTLRLDEVMLPAYGSLNITSSPEQGATVFIDGEKVGTTPFKSGKLASGEHTVELMMPMYVSVTKTCVVQDGNDGMIDIKMQPNFANVKLTVGDGVHIFVDNEDKGVGSWSGRLMQGEHFIEARLDGHRSTYKNITVTVGKSEDIPLEKPIPIYGQLNITSMPDGADILIDNQKVGITPMIMSKILVGSHELRLVKQGYALLVKTITIEEGKTTDVSEKLDSGKVISITTGRNGDEIYVDGVLMGVTPLKTAMSYGTHSVKAVRDLKSVEKTIMVSHTSDNSSVWLTFEMENWTFTINGISFEMVAVNGGTFTMGATVEQESDAYDSEKPTHSVTLDDYYIGEFEVTQELWEAVMGKNPSYFKGSNLPVENVSWKDCQKFIKKLNKLCADQLNGKSFRLPTEAEWEYAARGGNKGMRYKYGGSNNINEVAWYKDNSGSKTHAVGTKSPNELGIYDMSGNVWEWCQNWYGSYNSDSQTNPQGPSSGSNCVSRGGSWYSNARSCRVSNRYRSVLNNHRDNLGFRLAASK